MSQNIAYPKSTQNVAVFYGNGLVKYFGWEHRGFRKLLRKETFSTDALARNACDKYNITQEHLRVERGVK